MNEHLNFWKENPALKLALSLLIGTSSYLFWETPWNWIFPLLWALYLLWLRSWIPLLLIFGGALYSWALYSTHPASGKQIAYFSISSLQPHQSPFHRGFVYRGSLYTANNQIPCAVYFQGHSPPAANCDYLLSGQLTQREGFSYTFKAKDWVPIPKTWSLAEFRFRTKETFRTFLEQKLTRPRTATFLSSLITGDVEDRSLRYEFGRLGLQHILAISGFHFGILIAFSSFFLSFFLSSRWKIIFLLVAVNSYFLFVGSLPAVQRSWLTAQLYLISKLIGRQTTGLNLLGVALLIEVILNPLVSSHIGFQLSFLSCGGILLFHPHFERWLRKFLPKRKSYTLTLLSQHGYLLSSFLRNSLSIALSVNIALLPLLLYHFHQFPLLSLFYNLFFPFFVGGALFLLLLSLILYILFSPIAEPFFYLTDFWTAQLLDLAAYPPLALDYSIRVYSVAPYLIPLYLFGLFCIVQWLMYKRQNQ
ncbi:MAG TPA: ComEC/Rec2 family competence protein [Chlamydiales bacterium]|nr:ComEC/Rec2 family competence protein [Chlamydiales bacterium]